MAVAIKSVPVLKNDPAVSFNSRADAVTEQKGSIKFSKQIHTASKILAKAKI